MDAAQELRAARRSAGLTQATLAARAGTSQPAVSAYEAGRKRPGVVHLDRLLRATGHRLAVVEDDAPSGTAAPSGAATSAGREAGHRLLDVLELAEALPRAPRGRLRYPSLLRRP